jgi:hypothetical protein
VTRGERRDFLLDSGAVSALASDENLLVAYKRLLELAVAGSLHIPSPVMSEVRTGKLKYDALVDRMIKRIGAPQVDVYIPGSVETDNRAGELRHQALQIHDDISGVDAQVVAIAERRSRLCAVTIVTTDPDHIKALVLATGRHNIDVDTPS